MHAAFPVIFGRDGSRICNVDSYPGENCDDNAEDILQAVNAHDTLISELQEAQTIIHRLWKMTQNYNIPDSAHWPYMRERERLAVLAKAKEA